MLSEEFNLESNKFRKDELIYFKEPPTKIVNWKSLIKRHNIDFLLIDNYNLSTNLLNKLNNIVPVCLIADKKPYPNVSAVIVPHIVNEKKKNIFFGLKYAIVTSKFLESKKDNIQSNKIKNKLNILISFGAYDTKNITGKLISEILKKKELYNSKFKFTIVLGKQAPNIQSIKRCISKYEFINLRIQPKNFKNIILKSDFAIGAPGVSQIERMYLGLPTILIPQNKIQETIILNLKKNKLSLNINHNIKCVSKNIININRDELYLIKSNCLKLIDGKGSKRIAKIIEKYMVKNAN